MSIRGDERIVEDMTDLVDGAYEIAQATEEYDSHESQLSDIERRLERTSAEAEEVKEKFYEARSNYDDAKTVVETFAEALERERENKEEEIENKKKWQRRALIGTAAGLLGGGLYGLREDDPEWQETYQILAQDNLEPVARDMTSSNYKSLNELGHMIDGALDDHRRVALGLNPEYGDVGVKHNDYQDFVLQERVDLPDAYDRAKKATNF